MCAHSIIASYVVVLGHSSVNFIEARHGNYKFYNLSLLYYSLFGSLRQCKAVLSTELNIDVCLSKKLR